MDVLTAPPVSMLLTFSGHFRSRREELRTSSNGFELHGGTRAAVADIFLMMQWWCDGKKAVPTFEESRQFVGLFLQHEAAQELQVPDLMFEIIEARLKEVVETEIPYDEDLAEVYGEFEEGHEARRYTLDAWMNGYVSGRFDLEEDVIELFKDVPDLQRDVSDAVAKWKQRWDLDDVRGEVEEIAGARRDDEATASTGLGSWGQVTLPYR